MFYGEIYDFLKQKKQPMEVFCKKMFIKILQYSLQIY